MKTKVLKFGGGVLTGIERIGKVVTAVQSYKDTQVFVVVSAFFGITDKLQEVITNFKRGEDIFINITNIEKICYSYIPANSFDRSFFNNTFKLVAKDFRKLKSIFSEGKSVLSVSEECYVLSFGERISAIVLCEVLKSYKLDFEVLYPEKYGFYCEDDSFNADINIEKSRKSILPKIEEDTNYVMPGFYAISEQNEINVLGRGGTDYSASALAACLRSETMDIWKDVDGFRTADPQIIENTQKIDFLSYDEAAELSYFGATILHHQTVVPLHKLKISIQIFNIHDAGKKNLPGTTINGNTKIHKRLIKSLTSSNDFTVLKITGAQLGAKKGVFATITKALSRNKINIKLVVSGQTEINFLLSAADIDKAAEICSLVDIPSIERVSTVKDVSLIALIGEGLVKNYGVGSKIFASLASQKINTSMISFGASNVAIYFLVKKEDKLKALNVLHKDIVEKGILEN